LLHSLRSVAHQQFPKCHVGSIFMAIHKWQASTRMSERLIPWPTALEMIAQLLHISTEDIPRRFLNFMTPKECAASLCIREPASYVRLSVVTCTAKHPSPLYGWYPFATSTELGLEVQVEEQPRSA
jgi:hypothetical protein